MALEVALTRAQIGFDYDDAVTVARLYAAPADRALLEQRARAAVAARRQHAGVPADGEVPAPASYATSPIAFTLQRLGDGYFAVNLLSYLTVTTAKGEVRDSWYVGTQLVRWTEADLIDSVLGGQDRWVSAPGWRVVLGSSSDLATLLAEGRPQPAAPGTTEFEAAGWIAIAGTQR